MPTPVIFTASILLFSMLQTHKKFAVAKLYTYVLNILLYYTFFVFLSYDIKQVKNDDRYLGMRSLPVRSRTF